MSESRDVKPVGRAVDNIDDSNGERRLAMSDLILMIRLFIGIFYPKAVEPLQQGMPPHH